MNPHFVGDRVRLLLPLLASGERYGRVVATTPSQVFVLTEETETLIPISVHLVSHANEPHRPGRALALAA